MQSFLSNVILFNFVINKSDDKSRRRIVNLSIITSIHEFFYLRNFHIEDNNQSTEYLKQLIVPEMFNICNNDFSRCNSVCTDIYLTMRSFHEKMIADSQFANIFFVLCDFHEIQLFIKRIMKLSQFSIIVKQT